MGEQSMDVEYITVNGVEYPVAPMEPEKWDRPSPAYPVVITPDVAKSWLRHNYRNRTQRQGGKKDYGTDIQDGNFALNGATITFTRPHRAGEDELVPEGQVAILDGQHRLESCAAGNTPFVSYVAYGFAPEVRHTVDTGIKRTFGDVLSLRGETDSLLLASVVKKAYCWGTGDFHLSGKRKSTTHSALAEFLEKHPEVRRSAQIARHTHHGFKINTGHDLRASIVGVAHWLFMQSDPTEAPEFFERVGDGALTDTDDPIMVLRRRFVRDLTVRKQLNGDTRKQIPQVPDWQQLCYFIRTWNARLLWTELPETERNAFNFALVGPNDANKMPSIKKPDDILKELLAREEKRKAA